MLFPEQIRTEAVAAGMDVAEVDAAVKQMANRTNEIEIAANEMSMESIFLW